MCKVNSPKALHRINLVPMQYTSKLQSEINRLFEDYTTPDSGIRKNIIQFENLSLESTTFDNLVAELAEPTKPKQTTYAHTHYKHFKQILLNLARASVSNKWCALDGDNTVYKLDEFTNYTGLHSFRRTSTILKFLEANNLVSKVKGAAYPENPMLNLYLPAAPLAKMLIGYRLYTDNLASFNGDYLSINAPDPEYTGYNFKGTQDYLDMNIINEFAKDQSWASKSAITRRYKGNPYRSGRLITPFQNLKSRDYKVRINTLINDSPIVEVDFNANHLRMLIAMYELDVVGGEDAYAAIVSESGVTRDKVKVFFTRAMNVDNHYSHRQVLKGAGITFDEASKIYDAFQSLYPKVKLYSHFGLIAMNLEGEILKQVMLRGVKDGVLALPIHDACAAEAQYEQWAKDTMLEAWSSIIGKTYLSAKTAVKVTRS